MTEILTVYMGWDQRDIMAYAVCAQSLMNHSTLPLCIIPVHDRMARSYGYQRTYRVDEAGQMWDEGDRKPFSTAFSFARFAVPLIEKYADKLVVFCDPDMLWRHDIADLMNECSGEKALWCVQHDHKPYEGLKMDGVMQQRYRRKNWSSLMVMNPSRCKRLTKYELNRATGEQLHAMTWLDDSEIGALDERWNWLEGWSSPDLDPWIVHYTNGTPDFPGHGDAAYANEWASTDVLNNVLGLSAIGAMMDSDLVEMD